MSLRQGAYLVAVWGWSSLAFGSPQLPGAHTEAPSLPVFERLTCDEEGRIQQQGPPIGPSSESSRATRYDIIPSPDQRSALVKGALSTEPSAILVRCKGGRTTAIELRREQYRDPSVDVAQIDPGLDQMGWYQFTPDGSRLVFAVTAHSRRVNPDPPPSFQSTLLFSKFIVLEVASSKTTTIDTTDWGFNSYHLSDEHIVFRGTEATFRADFEGRITRLTPQGGRDLWTPELSPDGKWVAEILVDESYVLTNVLNPKQHITLAAAQKPWHIWNFNVFSPDSTLLAWGKYRNLPAQHSRDHTIHLFDIAGDERREILSVRDAYTILMKLSPDNRELLVYSYWRKPFRSARLFCVALTEQQVTVAPQHLESGNLYVDDRWTAAEIAVGRGKGTLIPIDCANWRLVDTIVGPPEQAPKPRPTEP